MNESVSDMNESATERIKENPNRFQRTKQENQNSSTVVSKRRLVAASAANRYIYQAKM